MADLMMEMKQIREHLHQHDVRFDKLEGRFDKLETEVGHLGTKLGLQLEQLQSTVQFLAEQMSGFNTNNANVRRRVESLEEKQSITELRLGALERRS